MIQKRSRITVKVVRDSLNHFWGPIAEVKG